MVTWWKAELPLGLGFTGRMLTFLISSAAYHSRVHRKGRAEHAHAKTAACHGVKQPGKLLSSAQQTMKSNLPKIFEKALPVVVEKPSCKNAASLMCISYKYRGPVALNAVQRYSLLSEKDWLRFLVCPPWLYPSGAAGRGLAVPNGLLYVQAQTHSTHPAVRCGALTSCTSRLF